MILDSLRNLHKYSIIPNIDLILEFIEQNDLNVIPEGEINLKGSDLVVKIFQYYPKEESKNYFETHTYHTDLQIIVKGTEVMQTANLQNLSVTDEFKLEGDFTFYKAASKISTFIISENEFAIFFNGDPHKPGCRYSDSNEMIKKVVFKIKMR